MSIDQKVIASVYHYTSAYFFEHMMTGMINGEKRKGNIQDQIKFGQKGLRLGECVMSFHRFAVPDGCKKRAIWSFLEPEPKERYLLNKKYASIYRY